MGPAPGTPFRLGLARSASAAARDAGDPGVSGAVARPTAAPGGVIAGVGCMRAFGGRAIVDLVGIWLGGRPRRAPAMGQAVGERVAQLAPLGEDRADPPPRLLGYRMAVEPEHAAAITQEYETWTTHAGSAVLAA